MNFSLHCGAELLTSEKSTTSFLSCSSVSGCPISWSSGLIPASPSLWPLFPWCNCLRAWWTCVSEADILSRQLVIKVHFFPDHLLQQHFPSDGDGSVHKGNKQLLNHTSWDFISTRSFLPMLKHMCQTDPYELLGCTTSESHFLCLLDLNFLPEV